MSTFGGKLQEYDNISIDRFDGTNLSSTAYFLSHFHKDHTVGLSAEKFHQHLKSGHGNFKLYCSKVTKILLLADDEYKHLEEYIKTLEINETHSISIPVAHSSLTEMVSVSFITANHCPGSVMCMFESTKSRVLYTGDFRWPCGAAEKQRLFYDTDNKPKRFDAVYVDTTFCFPEAYFIPSHDDSVRVIVDLCMNWIYRSKEHIICLRSAMKYGHEYLFRDVAQQLGRQIHINRKRRAIYNLLDEFKDVFCDADDSQIHVCLPKTCQRIRTAKQESKLRVIRPSTMWFLHNIHANKAVVHRQQAIRVCYCFHSSYSEIRDLIRHLNPRRVYPNVIPPSHADDHKVKETLHTFLSHPSVHTNTALGKLCSRPSVFITKHGLPESNDLEYGSAEQTSKTTLQCNHRDELNASENSVESATMCSSQTFKESQEASSGCHDSSYVPSLGNGETSPVNSCLSSLDDCDKNSFEKHTALAFLSGDDSDYSEILSEGSLSLCENHANKLKPIKSEHKPPLEELKRHDELIDCNNTNKFPLCENSTEKIIRQHTIEKNTGDLGKGQETHSDRTRTCDTISLIKNGEEISDRTIKQYNSYSHNTSRRIDKNVKLQPIVSNTCDQSKSDSVNETTYGFNQTHRQLGLISENIKATVSKVIQTVVESSYSLLTPSGREASGHYLDNEYGNEQDNSRLDKISTQNLENNKESDIRLVCDNGSLHSDVEAQKCVVSDTDSQQIEDGTDHLKIQIRKVESLNTALRSRLDNKKRKRNICQSSDKPKNGFLHIDLTMSPTKSESDKELDEEIDVNGTNDMLEFGTVDRYRDLSLDRNSSENSSHPLNVVTKSSSRSEAEDQQCKNQYDCEVISSSSDSNVTGPEINVNDEEFVVLSDSIEHTEGDHDGRSHPSLSSISDNSPKYKKIKISISSSDSSSPVTVSSVGSNDILQGIEAEMDREELTRLWCDSVINKTTLKLENVAVYRRNPDSYTASDTGPVIDLTQDSDSDVECT